MSAILVPGVTHRLLPGKSTTPLDVQVLNVHTMVWDLESCESYFARAGNPYSHFGTGFDGEVRQWQDLRFRAASCYQGNPYNVSIENADRGPGFPAWGGSDVPDFTDAQADSLVVLLSWLCHRFDLPRSAIATSCPHERGIGYHRLGIDPYRNASCGRRWSSAYGKACPGDRRIHTLKTEIIPAVSAPPGPAPTPPATEEEAAMLEEIKNLFVIYLKKDPNPATWDRDTLKSYNHHLWLLLTGQKTLEELRAAFQGYAGL